METKCHAVSPSFFFAAIFLQAGAYGLTFMLPRLFQSIGAGEKTVGSMLAVTAVTTVVTVYFSGHLSDIFGRLRTLCVACLAISVSLYLYGAVQVVGVSLVKAQIKAAFWTMWSAIAVSSSVILTALGIWFDVIGLSIN